MIKKDLQFYKFCAYGFLKNLRFFDAFIIIFFMESGFSFLQIGVLFSVREIVVNFTEIITGYLADYFGRKKAMLISFSNYILGFILFYFQEELYFIAIIAMILLGLGDTFRSGTHKAMILEYLKINGWENDKVEYYGYTRSWSQIGSAVSSLLAAVIVVWHGNIKIIFLASVVPYLLDFILILSYPSILDGGKQQRTQKSRLFLASMARDFNLILKNKSVRTIMLNTSTANAIFKAAKDYIQPMIRQSIVFVPVLMFLQHEDRSTVFIGVSYFLIYLISAWSSRNAGRFLEKVGNLYSSLNIIYVGFTIFLILLGGVIQLNWIIPGICLFVFLHVLQNIEKPIMVSAISETQDNSLMATALSIQNQMRALITAVLAPILGFLIDQFNLSGGFAVTGILLLIIFPALRLKHA
ncbi:MAG: hypothetical protein Kow00108_00040 [Calditrichia bacterium]